MTVNNDSLLTNDLIELNIGGNSSLSQEWSTTTTTTGTGLLTLIYTL